MRVHKSDEFTRLSLVKYAIRDLAPLAEELEAHGRTVYGLHAGDPIKHGFDIPEVLKRALIEVIEESPPSIHAYGNSSGDPELKEAIVELEYRKSGVRPAKEDIFITIGLSEAIHNLALALLEPGEFRTLPGPVYPLYMSHAVIADAKYNFYPVKPVVEDGGRREIDEDVLRRTAKDSNAIVVINPNNPASYVLDYRELYKIVDVAGEYGIPIIADQIYDDILFVDHYTHIVKIAKDVPVIVLNGFSKNFRITGRRVGYVRFYDPEKYLPKEVKETFSRKKRNRIKYVSMDFVTTKYKFDKLLRTRISGPMIIQRAIAKALKEYSKELWEDVRRFVEVVKKRMFYGYKLLKEIEEVEITEPQGAFYLFPKINVIKDEKCFVISLLEKYGYYTVPGSGFGAGGEKHIRILGLAKEEILEGFAEALRKEIEYIKNVRRGSQVSA